MNGIDVSHNNGVIDWSLVAKNATKVDFAYIKLSEGVGYQDPTFKFNSTQAKAYGIKTGYYHFASLNTTDDIADAKAEADYVISLLRAAPKADLPFVLDLETNKVGLDKEKVLEWIEAFFHEFRFQSTDVMLYSYTPFLDSNLPTTHTLGAYPLWIAAYVNGAPKLPHGWSNYRIWQYSSKGVVSGIKGNVDLNKTFN